MQNIGSVLRKHKIRIGDRTIILAWVDYYVSAFLYYLNCDETEQLFRM